MLVQNHKLVLEEWNILEGGSWTKIYLDDQVMEIKYIAFLHNGHNVILSDGRPFLHLWDYSHKAFQSM